MTPLSFGEAFSLRRSFGHAALAVRVALGPMWLGGLLMLIGDGCNPGAGDWSSLTSLGGDDADASSSGGAPRGLGVLVAASARGLLAGAAAPGLPELTGFVLGAVLAVVLVAMLVWLALFALGCWVTTGFVRMHVGILEREDDTLGPLFSGRDRFWSMFGYKSLAALSVSAAFFAAAWPGAMFALYAFHVDREVWMIGGLGAAAFLAVPAVVYVGLGTFLGELAVSLDGMDAVSALRRSWALASGNRLPMLVFAIASGLVQLASVLGLLLCCVGALATMPLARAMVGFAKTEGYLLFTRGREETARFALWRRAEGEAPRDLGPPAGPAPVAPPPAPQAP